MPNNLNATHDTVNTRFAEAARKYADRPALSSKPHGSKTWETLTYKDLAARVRQVTLGLRALGIEPGDRVAILSENRPEWAILDLATLAAGAVSVPVYPTLPASQIAHILSDSGAKMVVAENAKQTAKVAQARESAPGLMHVIALDEAAAQDGILSLAAVVEAGEGAAFEESFEARRDSVKSEDLMSLVYTSGTTGNPKGAMLTQGNMTAALDAANYQFPQFQPPNDVFLSFLPLSHVFERVTYNLAITQGAHTRFNDSIFKLMDNLAELEPTVMQCVPRVHESIHDRASDGIKKLPERRKTLTYWALGVGDAASTAAQRGQVGRAALVPASPGRRQADTVQGPGALRRTLEVLRQRRRPADRQDRPLLPRHRHPYSGRLGADRDHGGGDGQPVGARQGRHGRPAHVQRPGPDGGRRRDSGQRADRHARLLEQPRKRPPRS